MKNQLLLSVLLCCSLWSRAQNTGVSINPDGSPAHSSAILDVSSTSQGMLIPRLTQSERDAISNPALALQIFNTTSNCFEFFANGIWQTSVCACSAPAAPVQGSHAASSSQITWNWQAVPGATAYYYNTVNDFASATLNGNSLSFTQAGLTCNQSYTLYVWAHNTCGSSAVTTLSSNTGSCCPEASGGTITHSGGYTIHTFTASGTFTSYCNQNVELLVVGGGGGGSMGGGGAGGLIYHSAYAITPTSYTVTIGSGGIGKGNGTNASNGGNTVFGGLTAIGGGGGGGNSLNGNSGGSGGGCGIGGVNYVAGQGTSGQGNAGGNSIYNSSPYPTGGGGGAGAVGQDAQSSTQAGAGGIGLSYTISGSPVYYAGGGGGGAQNSGGFGAAGGLGGGGAGCGTPGCAGVNGTANTGGGGGAGDAPGVGGSGGSGVVIVRYLTP